MKELPYHGVYLVKNGKLQLLDRDPGGAPPQGIALSSDEKTLYVTNTRMFEQIFAYDVQPDDTVKNRRLFIDLVGEQGLGGPDGLCVDTRGNVYTAAKGGLWIISPAGKRLGKVPAPEGIRFASLAFGEPDRKTLYLVSAKNLWRLRVQISGLSPLFSDWRCGLPSPSSAASPLAEFFDHICGIARASTFPNFDL
jgi:gluconolactonase